MTTVAVSLAAAASTSPARAAYPGRNGAVAFVGERGTQKVYLRAGGRTRGLLRDATDPAFSPRGTRIAVTRELPETGRGIWIFGADGSGGRQLTDPALAGAEPSWAPGARKLAYAAGPHGQRRIHVVGADGRGDRLLTLGPADQHSPAWSRRNLVAFVQRDPGGDDIYTVPAAGGTPRRLTSRHGDDADPAWSPDGHRLAFVRGTGGIWIMGARGRSPRRVIHIMGGTEQGVAWSPDGRRLLFAGGAPGRRQIFSVKVNGKGLRELSLPGSNGRDPDWRSVGHAPVIAAAGDIACSPTTKAFNGGLGRRNYCRTARTSDLLLVPDLSAVLALGDLQYPAGNLAYFYDSFGPTWGRLRALMRPVPGNHEWRTPGASGYFDYFNGRGAPSGRAGDRRRGGYYSFDLGGWHIVGLASTCGEVPGGCDIGSPQQRWLARDLARHRARCTLAFWHHPLFSSLAFEEGRGSRETAALWKTLYDAGADLVLSGHQHFYERLAPQDAFGSYDAAHGMRSFVVGTGGRSLDNADFRDRNSTVFDAANFGVLELTLRPTSYEWRFRSTRRGGLADAGTDRCHR